MKCGDNDAVGDIEGGSVTLRWILWELNWQKNFGYIAAGIQCRRLAVQAHDPPAMVAAAMREHHSDNKALYCET